MEQKLTPRSRVVLSAIISRYVETGQPVSSLWLNNAVDIGLSPASIRRVMNELTVLGLITQTHASSGRIPTDQGFRAFVDALRTDEADVDTQAMQALKTTIEGSERPSGALWQRTVRLLSMVSRQAALVITPAFSDAVLRNIHFVPLDRQQLLAVIVTRNGLVHSNYIQQEGDIDAAELERMHNYLQQTIANRSLNDVRAILRHELADAIAQRDALREKATRLSQAAIENDTDGSLLVVEGRSLLVEQPELEGKLSALMETLDHKNRILDMLDQAAQSDAGPMVIIGGEGGDDFAGCALISSPFALAGGVGQVGILGSNRMNYPTLLPLVSLSARLISAALNPLPK
ncbi:MAG: heat-inducible transcriptional repressor HrcA [Proteobacteria bacterium]|nr:heat-inducible transcriptional repressor HrcA [Pseudomonadota bacterium]